MAKLSMIRFEIEVEGKTYLSYSFGTETNDLSLEEKRHRIDDVIDLMRHAAYHEIGIKEEGG